MAESLESRQDESNTIEKVGEIEKLKNLIDDLREIDSFMTEKGSVYTYDDKLCTTRLRKSGEKFEKQGIAVFVDLDDQEKEDFLDAYQYHPRDEQTKEIYVIERVPKIKKNKTVFSINEVDNPEELYLIIVSKQGVIKRKEASLMPKVGLTVFDYRQYKEGEEEHIERHIGHKVMKVSYKK